MRKIGQISSPRINFTLQHHTLGEKHIIYVGTPAGATALKNRLTKSHSVAAFAAVEFTGSAFSALTTEAALTECARLSPEQTIVHPVDKTMVVIDAMGSDNPRIFGNIKQNIFRQRYPLFFHLCS